LFRGDNLNIGVVGINHNYAPIEIRESASFRDTQKIEAINLLLDKGIEEVVILSTCNRSEIYFSCEDSINGIEIISNFYGEFFNEEILSNYIFTRKNNEAINHLFYVCAGLDSLIIGEDQILGQVIDTHEFCMTIGSSKKILNKIFREAITTSKEIKTKIKISEKPLSISYIGIKLLKEKIKTFKGKNALVIGVGKMNKLTIKYLQEEKIGQIYVSNRNHGKVKEIEKFYNNIIPIMYEDRYSILDKVDIIISATSSPHIVVKKDEIKNIKSELHIMDIALPRDIDPKVSEIKGVQLYDIDDLKKIQSDNTEKRKELSEIAKKIIEDKVYDLNIWLNSCTIHSTIGSLNSRCESIKKDTLDYIFRKIELDTKDKKIIDKILSSALKRMIREPIINLKNIEDDEKRKEIVDIIQKLFEI